jgi:hypothetical protein
LRPIDPVAWTNTSRALGKTYLASVIDGSAQDRDPAPDRVAFDIANSVLPASCGQKLCRRDGGSTFLAAQSNSFEVHGPHAFEKRKGALHAPVQPSKHNMTGESGAEDARTPNADAWSVASAGAKRLECVRFIRFIGAFCPADCSAQASHYGLPRP